MAVLAVLMLRGPQTPGELKTRTDRLHRFEGTELDDTIRRLAERDLVASLGKQPGQREERFTHLLSAAADAAEPPAVEATPLATAAPPASAAMPPDRLTQLERELAELRDEVRALREELGA
jgi:uncharacterized protein YceH (UPF0502 family)